MSSLPQILGDFSTNNKYIDILLSKITFSSETTIYDCGFGTGSIIYEIIKKMTEKKYDTRIIKNNIYGSEINYEAFRKTLDNLHETYGFIPNGLINDDFTQISEDKKFNYVIGHIPYGNGIEEKFINKMIKITKSNGKILVIIPSNATKIINSINLNDIKQLKLIDLDEKNSLLYIDKNEILSTFFGKQHSDAFEQILKKRKCC